jgi:hypothetical protein
MADKEKKAPETAKAPARPGVCKPVFLHSAGFGLWMYREPGVNEEDARSAGFFADARTRFGMKAGDIVLVNAGAGKTFMVGM